MTATEPNVDPEVTARIIVTLRIRDLGNQKVRDALRAQLEQAINDFVEGWDGAEINPDQPVDLEMIAFTWNAWRSRWATDGRGEHSVHQDPQP